MYKVFEVEPTNSLTFQSPIGLYGKGGSFTGPKSDWDPNKQFCCFLNQSRTIPGFVKLKKF
jgi:hypothetical protein